MEYFFIEFVGKTMELFTMDYRVGSHHDIPSQRAGS